MTIIKNLILKHIKKEPTIMTTHTLGKYILEKKTVPTPIYQETANARKLRRKQEHEIEKRF